MPLDSFASLRDIQTASGGRESYTVDASKLYGGVFGQSMYFPKELGTTEANHYMVFFVNELVTGKYKKAIEQRLSKDSPVFMQKGSTAGVKIINDAGDAIKGAVNDATKAITGKEAIKNKEENLTPFAPDYKRTSVCIALPPPEQVNMAYDTNWQMTTAPSLNLLAVGAEAFKTYQKEGIVAAGKQVAQGMGSRGVSKFATNLLGDVGNLVTKSINNPRREMLFDGVMPRRFAFQWNLFPRTPEEAKSVWDIIQMFKYHMLPELDDTKGIDGFFVNFPNTFDIEFHSNGKRNNWLPKTSTCALTRVDINYTPGGSYAFFKEIAASNLKNFPDGAAPVGVTLALEFAELETMYRNRIDPDANYTFGKGQGSNRGTF